MDRNKVYIITGANGHLGNTIIRLLKDGSDEIRGLILPSEQTPDIEKVNYIKGDVRYIDSLRALFEGTQDKDVYVIHTRYFRGGHSTRLRCQRNGNKKYRRAMQAKWREKAVICQLSACNTGKG